MAAGGNSSEWLKISHHDRKGVSTCGIRNGPQVKSDSPNVRIRGSNCALRGAEFREELKHESVFHKRDVCPALGEPE